MIKALLGGDVQAEYWLTRWLLQRGLAAIYLVGFLVAVNQFRPLLGTRGLTPTPFFLQQSSFWRSPSLFFVHYSDGFAQLLSWIGVICAALAVAGISERFGTPVSMLVWGVMWLIYLSIVNVPLRPRVWIRVESLLLECGFLAIFFGARNTGAAGDRSSAVSLGSLPADFGRLHDQVARRSVLARSHPFRLSLPEPAGSSIR